MAQKHNEEQINAPMTRFGGMGAQQDNKRIVRGHAYVATKWTAENPILQLGEVGYETDTGMLKVGDGVTVWNDLTYIGGGAGGLPDQTGNAGKFLTTDGTDASWSDKPLVNGATGTNSLTISGNALTGGEGVNIGVGSYGGVSGVAIGYQANSGMRGVAIGWLSSGGTESGIAIGVRAKSGAVKAIQIGSVSFSNDTTNSDANTLKVANSNGNFEMMSADGTIPTARLTKVNSTITLTAAGWSSNTQTVSVTGMTATGVVFVSPDPTDQSAYTSNGIYCTAQAAGTLTFTCDTVPSGDIDVNVVML